MAPLAIKLKFQMTQQINTRARIYRTPIHDCTHVIGLISPSPTTVCIITQCKVAMRPPVMGLGDAQVVVIMRNCS